MIHTTALENGRVAQRHDVLDVVSHAAHPWWRVHPLISCVVIGLIVVAAGGRILLAPDASQRQPPVVTTDADKSSEERLPVVEKAAAPAEPTGRHGPAKDPDGSERTGVEAKQTAEGGIGADSRIAEESDERPAGADGNTIATPKSEQAPSVDTPSPIETGSVKRADEPPATRIARVVSDVNMRAGPGNSRPVLAAISRGRSVEVIGCRQWCEVIFAGQRGWIYSSFIAAN